MPQDSPPRAWAEVKLDAIRHNLDIAKKAMPHVEMMPVIKASAYGHGLEAVGRALDNEGIAFFGVANVGEARRLMRAGCRTRTFILGPCFAQEREEIALNGWCPTVSTLEEARHFQSIALLYNKSIPVHLSIDTGMGRSGFLPDQWGELESQFAEFPNLIVEGVASHLPVADEDESFTLQQIGVFEAAAELLSAQFPIKYRQLANSAAVLNYKIPSGNLARPGLMLYGVSPMASEWDEQLMRALSLYARVSLVRTLPMGHGVSYGRDFITSAPTVVATVGIGYADGYSRQLSGKGACVYLHGRRCPVLGRITMDQIMIDVSAVPFVVEGDSVELIGEHIPLQEVAKLANTIPWEILTSLGPRLPRLY